MKLNFKIVLILLSIYTAGLAYASISAAADSIAAIQNHNQEVSHATY